MLRVYGIRPRDLRTYTRGEFEDIVNEHKTLMRNEER
jgi:hypothetical protein